MEPVRWHPAVLDIIARAQGSQMRIGTLWPVMRPALLRQAEAVLNALLREGYEVRPIDNDPPPAALTVDPRLMTDVILAGTTVPLRMRRKNG